MYTLSRLARRRSGSESFLNTSASRAPPKLDATVIVDFLTYLEDERGNTVRTRNTRLAAIHSFFRYSALVHPEHPGLIQRVLAIPAKRRDRADISFLSPDEVDVPCLPPLTGRLGLAGATTPCCW